MTTTIEIDDALATVLEPGQVQVIYTVGTLARMTIHDNAKQSTARSGYLKVTTADGEVFKYFSTSLVLSRVPSGSSDDLH